MMVPDEHQYKIRGGSSASRAVGRTDLELRPYLRRTVAGKRRQPVFAALTCERPLCTVVLMRNLFISILDVVFGILLFPSNASAVGACVVCKCRVTGTVGN